MIVLLCWPFVPLNLNLGSELIVKRDEKVGLAPLNDQAATDLAFGMSSFFRAADYLGAGLALLDVDMDSRWDRHDA
jgi:hypothetical protein